MEGGILTVNQNSLRNDLDSINRWNFDLFRSRPRNSFKVFAVSYLGPRGGDDTVFDQLQFRQLEKFLKTWMSRENQLNASFWLDKPYCEVLKDEPNEWVSHGLEPYLAFDVIRLQTGRPEYLPTEIFRAWLYLEWECCVAGGLLYQCLKNDVITQGEIPSCERSRDRIMSQMRRKSVWQRTSGLSFSVESDKESIKKWMIDNHAYVPGSDDDLEGVWISTEGRRPCWVRERDLPWVRNFTDLTIEWKVVLRRRYWVDHAFAIVEGKRVDVNLQGSMVPNVTWHVKQFRSWGECNMDLVNLVSAFCRASEAMDGDHREVVEMNNVDRKWFGDQIVITVPEQMHRQAFTILAQRLEEKRIVSKAEDFVRKANDEYNMMCTGLRCGYRHWMSSGITQGDLAVELEPFGDEGRIELRPFALDGAMDSQTIPNLTELNVGKETIQILKDKLFGTVESSWTENGKIIIETRPSTSLQVKRGRVTTAGIGKLEVTRKVGLGDALVICALKLLGELDDDAWQSLKDMNNTALDVEKAMSADDRAWNRDTFVKTCAIFEYEVRKLYFSSEFKIVYGEECVPVDIGTKTRPGTFAIKRKKTAVSYCITSVMIAFVFIALAAGIQKFRDSLLEVIIASLTLFAVTGPYLIVRNWHPELSVSEFALGRARMENTRRSAIVMSDEQTKQLLQSGPTLAALTEHVDDLNTSYLGGQKGEGKLVLSRAELSDLNYIGIRACILSDGTPGLVTEKGPLRITGHSVDHSAALHALPTTAQPTGVSWSCDLRIG